jgi:hypothetical protein
MTGKLRGVSLEMWIIRCIRMDFSQVECRGKSENEESNAAVSAASHKFNEHF